MKTYSTWIRGLSWMLGILFTGILHAQDIWVATATGEIYTIQLNDCQTKLIVRTQQIYTDIAWHPNGKLYGITANRDIYEIDFGNQQEYFIANLPTSRPVLDDFINSMVIDASGFFYFAGFSKDLFRFDLATRTTTVLGNMQYYASGDLTFANGNLYMAAQDNKIVQIKLDQIGRELLAIDVPTPKPVFGLVTLPIACDSTLSFAFSDGPPTEVYTVDFAKRNAVLKCRLNINVQGAASALEHVGSSNLKIDSVFIAGFECGQRNGQITAKIKGGVEPVVFSLDGQNYQHSPIFRNLPENEYFLYVRDAFGCTDTFPVKLPLPLPIIVIEDRTDPTCGLSNGRFTVNVSGGNAPYTMLINGNQLSGFTADFLGNGNYNIVITDAQGCSTQKSFVFQGPLPPAIVPVDVNNTSCGIANGSVVYTVEEGIAPIAHRWNGVNTDGTGVLTDLIPATYFLEIEDALGCTDTLTVAIAPSEPLYLDSVAVDQAYCGLANGQVTFFAREGSGPLSFSLNGQDYFPDIKLDSVFAGNYTAKVMDQAGCERSQAITVPGTEAPRWEVLKIQAAQCGDAAGAVTLKVSGGTPPLQVDGPADNEWLSAIEFLARGLSAGLYDFQVTDHFGCTDQLQVLIRDANCLVVLPSAFSPDLNGRNDGFEPLGSTRVMGTVRQFLIADRWGAIIHQEEHRPFGDPGLAWNGQHGQQAAAAGVYVWYLEILFDDGELRQLEGNVTLIR